jgi:integrase
MSVYLRGTCSGCGKRFFTQASKCSTCKTALEGTYWLKFRFEGQRIEESTGLTNKRAAERVEAKRLEDLRLRRAGLAPLDRPPLFEEYAQTFLAWSKLVHKPLTLRLHTYNIETLKRYFTGKRLDEISKPLIEDFKARRSEERRRNNSRREDAPQLAVSGVSVNRALTTLKLLFGHAMDHDVLVGSNPCRGVKYFAEPQRQRILSFDEQKRYLEHANETLRDIATLMTEMGFRPQDLMTLETRNVDLSNKVLDLWPLSAAGEIPKHGKTPSARRTVPITPAMVPILKRRMARAEKLETCWLFPSGRDPQRHITTVRKQHDAAIEAAGISGRVRLYDLRHTGLTRLHEAGVPEITLMRIAGHTSLQMTSRYVRTSGENLQDAARKLVEYQRLQKKAS